MLLRVATDLSELVVGAEQAEQENILGADRGVPEPLEVWRCEHPVLLTDTARIAALEPGLRDAVLALYESYPRTISYDGTSVSWSPTEFPRVWTASIDTLFFARTLSRQLDGVRSFAEIGCGSGFLTKYALMHATDIEHAVASDISLAAIRCTSATLAEVSYGASVSLVCPQADDPGFGLDRLDKGAAVRRDPHGVCADHDDLARTILARLGGKRAHNRRHGVNPANSQSCSVRDRHPEPGAHPPIEDRPDSALAVVCDQQMDRVAADVDYSRFVRLLTRQALRHSHHPLPARVGRPHRLGRMRQYFPNDYSISVRSMAIEPEVKIRLKQGMS